MLRIEQSKIKPIDRLLIRRRRWLFLLLSPAIFAFSRPCSAAGALDAACTYYASPAGTGNGKLPETPFPVTHFWRLAKPGDILCLLNGTYRGDSRISPPAHLNGNPDAPITVRALYDGKVLLDGEGKYQPIRLWYNDWFVIEGMNACCSRATVVEILRSNHVVVRKVAAWDAADGNHSIFGIHYGDYNLLEDVAGWGIARKIYESAQAGNFTTIRRAWGRWEGSHAAGPKMTYTLAYNNYDMLVENSIGTWSGDKMKKMYILLDYYGKPLPTEYTNYDVNQPYGIFAVDGFTGGDKNAKARLLGSIAYIKASDNFKAQRLVLVTKVDAVEIADTLAYVEPGSYPSIRTFGLYGLQDSTAVSLSAHNITSLGGAGAAIGKDWKTRNVLQGASPAIYGPKESAFSTTRGANLCHRYVDGVLTSQPLWPWPMNQRIIDATQESGRTPVDVMAAVESMLGPIPTECKSNTTASGKTDSAESRP